MGSGLTMRVPVDLSFTLDPTSLPPGPPGRQGDPGPRGLPGPPGPPGPAAGGASPKDMLDVREIGAKGDGSTDDSAAIRAAVDAVVASKGVGTGPARLGVYFPPGRYRITQPDTLMSPSDGENDGLTGLQIAGAGKGTTELIFDPHTTSRTDPWVGNLFSARKRTRFMHLRDMTITSRKPDANAFYFYGYGQGANMNQGCTFSRVHFTGNWQRVFGFDGPSDANLNSEMTFDGVTAGTAAYSDAFLKVGGISGTHNQQNQFLDYWFYNSFFILNGGTLIDFVKGGSAHFIGGSWSAASSSSPAMTFIKLGKNFNNTSAANFSFAGIRFEPKAANHTVLDDQIGHGAITFDHCIDVSSLQHAAGMDYPLRRHAIHDPWGYPIQTTVTYRGCSLAGYSSFTGGAGESRRGWLSYEGCYFWRGTGGNEASHESIVRWDGARPRYRLSHCWNADDTP